MQTSISNSNAIAYEGLVGDNRVMKHIQSRLLEGFAKVGRGVFRVPGYGNPGSPRSNDPGQVYQVPSPASAASVDAILATGGVSAATQQTWEGAELNGAVGTGTMLPARQITLTLSSHTDWDATNAVLTGVNQLGQTVSENLAIPNAGAATVASVNTYRSVTSLVIPAQTGAGGTFTIGISILDSAVTLADFEGVVIYDASVEPANATYEFEDGDAVSLLYKGTIWVRTEDACSAGGGVFVRVGGSGDLGAFRSDVDGGGAVQVTGARYAYASSAGGLNMIELY